MIIKKYKLFLENKIIKLREDSLPDKIEMTDDANREFEYINSVIETIKRNCKPFLSDIKRINITNSDAMRRAKELKMFPDSFENFGFLWRGVKKIDSSNILFEKPPHLMTLEETNKNRYPRDISYEVHKLLDDEFNKQFGIRPRSSGIFTTPKYGVAKGYGGATTPFLVFPIGDYKFIWSNDIYDLFSEIVDEYWYYGTNSNSPSGQGRDSTTAEESIPSIVNSYQMDDLRSALLSGHEMSIICDKYYLVSPHEEIIREFYNR